jgi:hypothetical protein
MAEEKSFFTEGAENKGSSEVLHADAIISRGVEGC